ncbi:DUF2218 domain-containing protein [Aurantimonas sp. VKM B-3413]|uniref:DUF2218 domain-containing protein n=1 Tax=Aurantimonas sp. VKM B-3413 TaxID=2779401 RepID=UPI001E4DF032|nr:DUF2218 domain-containing protein [Aurantimonas sp. VKM B-3413]MCB8839171.1 DUF2218 domain-containing protein [Aurantimonas sp. VKM B-3413]
MPSAEAHVATDNASRYLQQLCKHWSHKFETTFDPRNGVVRFDAAQSLALTATESEIHMTLAVEDQANLARMQEVVAEHLQRFAFRENLTVDWRPV